MLVATGFALSACSSGSSTGAIDWWHRQQGGKIAEQRPAPPGADQPYPQIVTVPARPEAPNQDELRKLTESLVADRTNAQHAAQAAPLADPSSPIASPGLFGVGSAPPPPPRIAAAPASSGGPGTQVASASMPAVTAPAAPPTPAPQQPVQTTALPAPPAPASVSPRTGNAAPRPATSSDPRQPALPSSPPERPTVAGSPPPAIAMATPMPQPASASSASIVFLQDASNLTGPAADEVKAFAAKRGNATIVVTGYGDANSNAPDAQSEALNLGLARAQSIVDALKADGVPGSAIRVSAEAAGRGASLRLLQPAG